MRRVLSLIAVSVAMFAAWYKKYADHLIKSLDVRMTKKSGTLSKGEVRRLQLVLAMRAIFFSLLRHQPNIWNRAKSPGVDGAVLFHIRNDRVVETGVRAIGDHGGPAVIVRI